MRESRQVAKCRKPLELTPEAQQAFASRQAKLINNPQWPMAGWYNDEDFCRAYNTAVQLQAKIERLQTIVDKLPKTADGVPAVLGMALFRQDGEFVGRHASGCVSDYYSTRKGEVMPNTWPGGYRHAMHQSEHGSWNAANYPGTLQLCSWCDEPTGRCEDDSIYSGDGEPLCTECYDASREDEAE